MSVHTHERADGQRRYIVRWREAGQNRKRTFDRRRDAELWDGEVRRSRQLGALHLLDAGGETLDEYVTDGWVPAHTAHLAPRTLALYTWLYDTYVSSHLGAVPLRDLTAERIARWQAERLKAGGGREQVRKAHTLLGNILQRAVESGRIPANPQRLVRKAKAGPRREVRPLPPAVVERMRRALIAGDAPSDHPQRDAALVAVLAYAGLRPGEALELRWGHVQDNTLVIHAPKTGQQRSVRLLAPLASDLRAWRLASGRPGAEALVFPSATGGRWTEEAYKSWARRPFAKAAKQAGASDASPYTLRHSFCSLLLHEGRSVPYVARQMGHGAQLTLSTYGHVIDELDGQERAQAEDLIRAARARHVPPSFPSAAGASA